MKVLSFFRKRKSGQRGAFRLPSGKSVVFWAVAIAMALWSLPDAPTIAGWVAHTGVHVPPNAIPTMAVPSEPSNPSREPVTPKPSQQPSGQVNGTTTPKATVPPTTPVAPQQEPSAGTPPTDMTPTTLPKDNMFSPYVPIPTAKLRIRVIDGRTQKPLEGAEVVIIETEQRVTTNQDGVTKWVDVPIIRNPRYRPMVAELHGQLGAIAYKNGYRDSIHLGIRMHDGKENETTIWMYKIGPGDQRIEPVLYQVPYHHIWLVELADKFRSKSQPGEGPERP